MRANARSIARGFQLFVLAAIKENEEAIPHCLQCDSLQLPRILIGTWGIIEPIASEGEGPPQGLHVRIPWVVIAVHAKVGLGGGGGCSAEACRRNRKHKDRA